MKYHALLLTAVILLSSFAINVAEEAMWPIYDLNKLDFDQLKDRGLHLAPEQISNTERTGIADAVIRLRGGTASFVSPDGLILTNHHVAFSAIQKQSTTSKNLLVNGFYAANMKDEIPAIGFYAYVNMSTEDITERVLANINDDMDPLERYNIIEAVTKKIIKEVEAGRDVKCRIKDMYGGKQYILFTDFKIEDIRIVYAPPRAIGNYGDEIDNWMWPRHCGDFSFLRAYVAPDGSSAVYAEENVPYKPKTFLSISSQGIDEDELILLLGFPGKTDRFAISHQIQYLFDFFYPRVLKVYNRVISLIDDMEETNAETKLRLASTRSNIENYQKKFGGLIEGFHRLDMLNEKKRIETELESFIKSNPQLSDKYGKLLEQFDSLYQIKAFTQEKDFILNRLLWGCDLLNYSCDLHKWSIERKKPDIDREPTFQNRDTSQAILDFRDAQINLVPEFDKRVLKMLIQLALKLPEGQRIKAIDQIFENNPEANKEQVIKGFLDDLYSRTEVDKISGRLTLFHMSRKDLENVNDSFIKFAISLRPELDEKNEREKKFKGVENRLKPALLNVYLAWKSDQLYPDANSTKRINFGQVAGYSTRDAVKYSYLTSLTGLMQKETGVFPFIVPDELKTAFARKDSKKYIDTTINDIPVNFTTTNCGTNGNSGSPMINGKGEIVGLNFDGNLESVADDYMFNPALSRSIGCDSRYILFIIDEVYHLDRLLNELNIR